MIINDLLLSLFYVIILLMYYNLFAKLLWPASHLSTKHGGGFVLSLLMLNVT